MTAAAQRSQEEAHLYQQSIQESQAYNEEKHKENQKSFPNPQLHLTLLFLRKGDRILHCTTPPSLEWYLRRSKTTELWLILFFTIKR